ncbi:unnamed protein product [Amoebophrya sp. A120]|nr:unnamed protein product [Amoebophrya sp. A120]|eukprot:GSA120T00008826001.1
MVGRSTTSFVGSRANKDAAGDGDQNYAYSSAQHCRREDGNSVYRNKAEFSNISSHQFQFGSGQTRSCKRATSSKRPGQFSSPDDGPSTTATSVTHASSSASEDFSTLQVDLRFQQRVEGPRVSTRSSTSRGEKLLPISISVPEGRASIQEETPGLKLNFLHSAHQHDAPSPRRSSRFSFSNYKAAKTPRHDETVTTLCETPAELRFIHHQDISGGTSLYPVNSVSSSSSLISRPGHACSPHPLLRLQEEEQDLVAESEVERDFCRRVQGVRSDRDDNFSDPEDDDEGRSCRAGSSSTTARTNVGDETTRPERKTSFKFAAKTTPSLAGEQEESRKQTPNLSDRGRADRCPLTERDDAGFSYPPDNYNQVGLAPPPASCSVATDHQTKRSAAASPRDLSHWRHQVGNQQTANTASTTTRRRTSTQDLVKTLRSRSYRGCVGQGEASCENVQAARHQEREVGPIKGLQSCKENTGTVGALRRVQSLVTTPPQRSHYQQQELRAGATTAGYNYTTKKNRSAPGSPIGSSGCAETGSSFHTTPTSAGRSGGSSSSNLTKNEKPSNSTEVGLPHQRDEVGSALSRRPNSDHLEPNRVVANSGPSGRVVLSAQGRDTCRVLHSSCSEAARNHSDNSSSCDSTSLDWVPHPRYNSGASASCHDEQRQQDETAVTSTKTPVAAAEEHHPCLVLDEREGAFTPQGGADYSQSTGHRGDRFWQNYQNFLHSSGEGAVGAREDKLKTHDERGEGLVTSQQQNAFPVEAQQRLALEQQNTYPQIPRTESYSFNSEYSYRSVHGHGTGGVHALTSQLPPAQHHQGQQHAGGLFSADVYQNQITPQSSGFAPQPAAQQNIPGGGAAAVWREPPAPPAFFRGPVVANRSDFSFVSQQINRPGSLSFSTSVGAPPASAGGEAFGAQHHCNLQAASSVGPRINYNPLYQLQASSSSAGNFCVAQQPCHPDVQRAVDQVIAANLLHSENLNRLEFAPAPRLQEQGQRQQQHHQDQSAGHLLARSSSSRQHINTTVSCSNDTTNRCSTTGAAYNERILLGAGNYNQHSYRPVAEQPSSQPPHQPPSSASSSSHNGNGHHYQQTRQLFRRPTDFDVAPSLPGLSNTSLGRAPEALNLSEAQPHWAASHLQPVPGPYRCHPTQPAAGTSGNYIHEQQSLTYNQAHALQSLIYRDQQLQQASEQGQLQSQNHHPATFVGAAQQTQQHQSAIIAEAPPPSSGLISYNPWVGKTGPGSFPAIVERACNPPPVVVRSDNIKDNITSGSFSSSSSLSISSIALVGPAGSLGVQQNAPSNLSNLVVHDEQLVQQKRDQQQHFITANQVAAAGATTQQSSGVLLHQVSAAPQCSIVSHHTYNPLVQQNPGGGPPAVSVNHSLQPPPPPQIYGQQVDQPASSGLCIYQPQPGAAQVEQQGQQQQLQYNINSLYSNFQPHQPEQQQQVVVPPGDPGAAVPVQHQGSSYSFIDEQQQQHFVQHVNGIQISHIIQPQPPTAPFDAAHDQQLPSVGLDPAAAAALSPVLPRDHPNHLLTEPTHQPEPLTVDGIIGGISGLCSYKKGKEIREKLRSEEEEKRGIVVHGITAATSSSYCASEEGGGGGPGGRAPVLASSFPGTTGATAPSWTNFSANRSRTTTGDQQFGGSLYNTSCNIIASRTGTGVDNFTNCSPQELQLHALLPQVEPARQQHRQEEHQTAFFSIIPATIQRGENEKKLEHAKKVTLLLEDSYFTEVENNPRTTAAETYYSARRFTTSSPTRELQYLKKENQKCKNQMSSHLQEYIDPLAQVPRTPPELIVKMGRIMAKFAAEDDMATRNRLAAGGGVGSGYNANQAAHFYIAGRPNLGIEQYVDRLRKYFHCSLECFVLAFIYIDRVVTLNRSVITLGSGNVHRLLLASLTVATKYWDDIYYSNGHYAKVGGVTTREIDNMEYQFLCLVNWRLFVSPDEFKGYMNMINTSPL